MTVRILIADNKNTMRRRVRQLLSREPGMAVVGEAADGHEAVRMARELRPDVVIMDVGMPGMNGLVATQQIASEMPDLKVIMLTVYDLPEYAEAAAACGASGYVIKTSLYEDLMPAIERATGGSGNAAVSGGAAGAEAHCRNGAAEQRPDPAEEQLVGMSCDGFEDLVTQLKVRILRNSGHHGCLMVAS